MDPSDQHLIQRCIAGDSNAFSLIVDRYQHVVWTTALARTGDAALSEDVTQETFLRAWRKLDTLTEPAKLRSWLCSIARNVSVRNAQKHGLVAESDTCNQQASDASALDAMIGMQEREATWSALQQLPPQYREALVLYYREGQSTETVSVHMGITISTLTKRLSRGRQLLKERLQPAIEVLESSRPPAAIAVAIAASIAGTRAAAAATLATPTILAKVLSMKFTTILIATVAALLTIAGVRQAVSTEKQPSIESSRAASPTASDLASLATSTEKAETRSAVKTEVTRSAAEALREYLRRRQPNRSGAANTPRVSKVGAHAPLEDFVAARELWDGQDYEAAIPKLQRLIEKYPEHDVGNYATGLLFDSMVKISANPADMYYWADLHLENETLLEERDDLKTHLLRIREVSLRKMAEEWEAEGDYEGCYLSYLSILDAYPEIPTGDEVLHNAAICAELAGMAAEAQQAWADFVLRYPGSPHLNIAREHLKL